MKDDKMRRGGSGMSGLMRRLRRRGKCVYPTWRICYYDGADLCEVVELVRKYRPTRKARALMCAAYTHFEIEQVA